MTAHNKKIPPIISLLVAFVLAGCAPTRAPPDLLGNATRVLDQAKRADAQVYAPLELRFASERYDQAQSAMATTDYDSAARLAQESVANSELAIVKAQLGKNRAAVDALNIQNEELRRNLDTIVEGGQP